MYRETLKELKNKEIKLFLNLEVEMPTFTRAKKHFIAHYIPTLEEKILITSQMIYEDIVKTKKTILRNTIAKNELSEFKVIK